MRGAKRRYSMSRLFSIARAMASWSEKVEVAGADESLESRGVGE
jgi:hypothetical protein